VERRGRIRGLPALLTGRLFDEQGLRMTPTHTTKKGVRYSYYVSQAVLRKHSAVLIGRVAAPELEALVVDAVRRHAPANSTASNPILETDRELIERHLLRATLSTTAITLHLRQEVAGAEGSGPDDLPDAGRLGAAATKVTIPWTVPARSIVAVIPAGAVPSIIAAMMAFPLLGRAGTADKRVRTGPSAQRYTVSSPAGGRDVLIGGGRSAQDGGPDMASDARFRDALKSLLAALGSPEPRRRQKARQTIRDTARGQPEILECSPRDIPVPWAAQRQAQEAFRHARSGQ
jgi:hypothetical protein